MASLWGVKPSLATRIQWMIDESETRASKKFWVTSGYRDENAQWREWNRWQEDIKRHGSAAKAIAAGCAIAAYPGTSLHEKKDRNGNPAAEAVDVGCLARDNAIRIQLRIEAGLVTPIPSEKWHMQEAAGAAIPISKKEVLMAEKDRPYVTIQCPTGGYWRLKKDNGGVGALNGAPFFGAMPLNEKGESAKVVAPLVGLTPCVRGGRVIGYWIYDEAGHLYAYGDAPYFTDYASHPEWGGSQRIIDGLVQTAGFEPGQQIRYCFTAYEIGDREYIPDTYDIGREFK